MEEPRVSQSIRSFALVILAAAVTACDLASAPEGVAQDAVDAPAVENGGVARAAEAAAPARQAAPAPTPSLDWHTRADMEGGQPTMRLAFEMPDTDHQPLAMDCLRGSGTVTVDHQSSSTGLNEITLTSDGVTRTYAAKGEPDEMTGGDYLTAEISANDPVMAAFRRTGWLSYAIGGETGGLASQANSGAAGRIDDFFAFCSVQE